MKQIVVSVRHKKVGKEDDYDVVDHLFIKTSFFCLRCGVKAVWTEPDSSLNGAGDLHLCAKCGNAFYGRVADTADLKLWDAFYKAASGL
jgi:hypothetical protein